MGLGCMGLGCIGRQQPVHRAQSPGPPPISFTNFFLCGVFGCMGRRFPERMVFSITYNILIRSTNNINSALSQYLYTPSLLLLAVYTAPEPSPTRNSDSIFTWTDHKVPHTACYRSIGC